jgi:hypothetical protein
MTTFAPLIFVLLVGSLLGVGAVSWRRTGSLRRGSIPVGRGPPGASFSSSKTTFLAALAGISAAAWGGGAAADRRLILAVLLMVLGLFVAVAGSTARVIGFRLEQENLVVLFAARPSRSIPWSSLLALRPPAGPLGGWRLTGAHGIRSTLMPSDLFGHEELLALIVVRARLTFDGRKWIRAPAEAHGRRVDRRFSPWRE